MHRVATVLGLVATLAACGNSQIDELSSAKARWNQRGLDGYTFEYERSCFCLWEGQKLQVTVLGGVVSEVKRADTGETVQASQYGGVPTIAELFDELDRASRQAEAWSAAFDADQGYPRIVSIDWKRSIADDESTEHVSALVATP